MAHIIILDRTKELSEEVSRLMGLTHETHDRLGENPMNSAKIIEKAEAVETAIQTAIAGITSAALDLETALAE